MSLLGGHVYSVKNGVKEYFNVNIFESLTE